MKRIFAIIAAIFLTNCAFADLKYIEIESKQNLPMIRIKTIEDFETKKDMQSAKNQGFPVNGAKFKKNLLENGAVLII